MKTTKFKKIMALLLTGLMTVSMFSGVALADEPAPEDYVATNTYVMNYSSQDIEGYEDWDAKRFYFSPFRTDITVKYNPVSGEGGHWNWCSASVLNMIDTGKLGTVENPTGPYASIPVYCVDATTTGVTGFDYERVNLEDSSYFSDEVAGRVRAIIMNTFPHISDMSVITNAVNAWIDENGLAYDKVENLHYYEAISATQSVIWVLTNEGELGTKVYLGEDMVKAKAQNPVSIYGVSEELDYSYETENTAGNIEAVARFLMDLAPMAPKASLISETAFENLIIEKVEEADGTYTLTVSVKVVVDENAKSDLKLTAVLDGKVYEEIEGITNTGEYTFVIAGTTENSTVKLAIDGTQSAGDVYLFAPEGGRHKSQTMAGYDESSKPVHAEITIGPERIINFNKIGRVEKDGVTTNYPLEGIQFEIYYAGTVDDYTAFAEAYVANEKNAAVLEKKTAEEVNALIQAAFTAQAVENKTGEPVVVTTDATGKATHNFGRSTDADGIYLIIERENPAIMEALAPFVVALPMTAADGNGLSYVLNLQPKNKVYPGPEVDKYITEIGKEVDSFDIGEIHTWVVCGDIPVDIATAKSYVLTDTMDYRLTYKGNVKVSAVNGEKSEPLTADDYILTVGNSKDKDGNAIDIFKVELTKAGREKAAAFKGGEICVSFDAIIDEDADNAAGVKIPNEVSLDYENTVGVEFYDEDDAEVFTCGVNIYKYDAKDEATPLAGATFKLAKIVDEKTVGAVQLVIGKGDVAWVVYETFYNTPVVETADEAGKVNFVETDKDGKAMIYGLAEGTYYLVETKAPAGYNLLSYPVLVKLGDTSHLVDDPTTKLPETDNTIKVANSNTFKLPETGGIGTVIFTVSGGLMTLAGGTILALKKREEE